MNINLLSKKGIIHHHHKSLLTIETIRKERTGCMESDTTEQLTTHKERAKRTPYESRGPCQGRHVAMEGWGTDFKAESFA